MLQLLSDKAQYSHPGLSNLIAHTLNHKLIPRCLREKPWEPKGLSEKANHVSERYPFCDRCPLQSALETLKKGAQVPTLTRH